MKSFNFKSATNTKEAVKLISGRATFLAGGMTLLPAIKLRLAAYSDLINIKRLKVYQVLKYRVNLYELELLLHMQKLLVPKK